MGLFPLSKKYDSESHTTPATRVTRSFVNAAYQHSMPTKDNGIEKQKIFFPVKFSGCFWRNGVNKFPSVLVRTSFHWAGGILIPTLPVATAEYNL